MFFTPLLYIIQQALVLQPSCVPEKVGKNQNALIINNIPIKK